MPKHSKVIHNLIDRKDKSLCWTPLHWACSTGKVEAISTLLYHGADPFILSNLNFNILHAAAESRTMGGLASALNIWKKHPGRLNINQQNHWGETPLHIAAWGSIDNVRLLVEAGADRAARQEEGQIPLHYTGMTARGNVRSKIIGLLCENETEEHINIQDTAGRPALLEFLDSASSVESLVQHGAKLDLLDDTGKSAFHHSCLQGHDTTLSALLRLSPPGSVIPTIKDHDGNTALILALKAKAKACALTLLSLDDVGDPVGQDGWACIHHAAAFGDADVLEAVLAHPSCCHRPDLRTIDGKTADVIAMEAGNWQGRVRELLRSRNAVFG